MPELTIILDAATGAVLVGDPDHLPAAVTHQLTEFFGPPRALACAVPLSLLHLPAASAAETAGGRCVRVSGVAHNSLIEGRGRRSTAKFQGCAIRCEQCITPDSWDPSGGYLVPVDRLADALLDPAYDRDGVTILGGEPFQQPDGLLALVRALRMKGCPHVLCYSGYTYEVLRRRARREPTIGTILDEIDVLIDGPYVQALADWAGPWTGSGNQRVIDLRETRKQGKIVLSSTAA